MAGTNKLRKAVFVGANTVKLANGNESAYCRLLVEVGAIPESALASSQQVGEIGISLQCLNQCL